MPDENGTEVTRPDAPSADESLFGEAADETPAAAAEEQDSAEESGTGPGSLPTTPVRRTPPGNPQQGQAGACGDR